MWYSVEKIKQQGSCRDGCVGGDLVITAMPNTVEASTARTDVTGGTSDKILLNRLNKSWWLQNWSRVCERNTGNIWKYFVDKSIL